MGDSGRRRLLRGLVAAGLLPGSLASAATGRRAAGRSQEADVPDQAAWSVAELEARRAAEGRPWLGFFDAPTMRMGIYSLPAGGEDRQTPHDADEAYYVVSGRAALIAGDQCLAAEPGTILFVKASVEHRFVQIEEDLRVLVFFAAGADD